MAIFGDVNDNRVIPLILLSGMIFLTGMYIVYLYKWLRSILRSNVLPRYSDAEFDGCDGEEGGSYPHQQRHDMARKQSTISAWDMETTIVSFQPTIKELPEEYD